MCTIITCYVRSGSLAKSLFAIRVQIKKTYLWHFPQLSPYRSQCHWVTAGRSETGASAALCIRAAPSPTVQTSLSSTRVLLGKQTVWEHASAGNKRSALSRSCNCKQDRRMSCAAFVAVGNFRILKMKRALTARVWLVYFPLVIYSWTNVDTPPACIWGESIAAYTHCGIWPIVLQVHKTQGAKPLTSISKWNWNQNRTIPRFVQQNLAKHSQSQDTALAVVFFSFDVLLSFLMWCYLICYCLFLFDIVFSHLQFWKLLFLNLRLHLVIWPWWFAFRWVRARPVTNVRAAPEGTAGTAAMKQSLRSEPQWQWWWNTLFSSFFMSLQNNTRLGQSAAAWTNRCRSSGPRGSAVSLHFVFPFQAAELR